MYSSWYCFVGCASLHSSGQAKAGRCFHFPSDTEFHVPAREIPCRGCGVLHRAFCVFCTCEQKRTGFGGPEGGGLIFYPISTNQVGSSSERKYKLGDQMNKTVRAASAFAQQYGRLDMNNYPSSILFFFRSRPTICHVCVYDIASRITRRVRPALLVAWH